MVKWLKHAFAVDPPGPVTPTEDQKRVVERLASEVVRRGLTAPALLFLESSRPLNYIGSQLLVFCAPFAEIIFKPADYRALTTFLEHRGSVEYTCRRIEALDQQAGRKKAVAASVSMKDSHDQPTDPST